jgi:hypothetical protein
MIYIWLQSIEFGMLYFYIIQIILKNIKIILICEVLNYLLLFFYQFFLLELLIILFRIFFIFIFYLYQDLIF